VNEKLTQKIGPNYWGHCHDSIFSSASEPLELVYGRSLEEFIEAGW
jgi:hypothetical protein